MISGYIDIRLLLDLRQTISSDYLVASLQTRQFQNTIPFSVVKCNVWIIFVLLLVDSSCIKTYV